MQKKRLAIECVIILIIVRVTVIAFICGKDFI